MSSWTRLLREFLNNPIETEVRKNRDYFTDVGFGLVEGHSGFIFIGNNQDVDQVTVPENFWPGGGLYPWMTGATSLEVVSSSAEDGPTGTGIKTIVLTVLDVNYVQSNIFVNLNGTTPVAISGQWFRINGASCAVKGSGAPAFRALNVGDITVRDAGAGTTRAVIKAGIGNAQQCLFTVPLGFTAQLLSIYIGFDRGTGGGATRYLTASPYLQFPTGVTQLGLNISCDGQAQHSTIAPGLSLPEKTDCALEIISVSADNSNVTGAIFGVMKSNYVDQY